MNPLFYFHILIFIITFILTYHLIFASQTFSSNSYKFRVKYITKAMNIFLFHKKVQSQRFAMCTTTVRAVSYSTKKDNVCTLPFDFSVSLLLTPDITVRYAGNLFVSFFAKCNPIITYLCNNRKLQRLVPEIPVGFLYQYRQLIGSMLLHSPVLQQLLLKHRLQPLFLMLRSHSFSHG